jgi:hypothetical protein
VHGGVAAEIPKSKYPLLGKFQTPGSKKAGDLAFEGVDFVWKLGFGFRSLNKA